MAVRIPNSPRVIYAKNPLTEVIVQVRFPPILAIAERTPSDFQEAIRERFPRFGEVVFEIAASPIASPTQTRSYQFGSDDGVWTVTLTREFLALTTTRYDRWEAFAAQLRAPLEALFNVYRPHATDRIGLRYVDLVRREPLDLAGVPWTELFEPWVLGEWRELASEDDVQGYVSDILLKLDGDARVRLRHGLASHEGEIGYRIDTDFFVEASRAKSVDEVFQVLHPFNGLSGRLFRSLIREKLHAAMEPQEVSP